MEIIDSPLLWSGKKTKLLNQLKPLFYKNADMVYDMFSGSGSILPNIDCDNVVGNDLYSGKLLEKLRTTNYDDIINHMDKQINKFNLTKVNKEEYYIFKDYILAQKETNQLDLFTLGLFCFNGRLEFNNEGKITSAFGKRDRSNVIKSKLKKWKENLPKKCKFMNMDYIDMAFGIARNKEIFDEDIFVYVDPLYSITRTNGYNSETYSDKKLFEILNEFDKLGINWGMSNVFAHKNKINRELIEFAKKYNVKYLDFDYSNNNRSNNLQQKIEQNNETVEVYIYNFDLS